MVLLSTWQVWSRPGGNGPLGTIVITLIDVGSWRAECQVRHFPFLD